MESANILPVLGYTYLTQQNKLQGWFDANVDDLMDEYKDRFLVISENAVKGSFQFIKDAYYFAESHYAEGNFIVRECVPTKVYQEIRHV